MGHSHGDNTPPSDAKNSYFLLIIVGYCRNMAVNMAAPAAEDPLSKFI